MYRNFPKGITLLSSLFCHRPREMFALWNSERTFHWASKIISQGQASFWKIFKSTEISRLYGQTLISDTPVQSLTKSAEIIE